jgi:general secretion pathway protein H
MWSTGNSVRPEGFTLVELLVVLVIAAAAVTLALPQFSRLASFTALKSSARELAAALRAARSDAIARQRESALLIDLRAQTYRLEGAPRAHPLRPGLELALLTAQTEVKDAERGAIRFFSDGSSSGGRVALGANGRRTIIDVDWLTGRVVIRE